MLRAGPVSALYVDGDLRHIRIEDREVLRRVYFALPGETSAETSSADNLRTLRLVFGAYDSARSGQVVSIDA
jgi:hypothetical protein